jgi:3-mercaptopyruvate sulfurtransferase SseA
MKFMKLMLLIATASALAISLACAAETGNGNIAANAPRSNAAVPTPDLARTATPHESERISLADAKKAFDENSAVFVDVRSPDAYKEEHIRGALNVPLAELDANVGKFPKGKKIIVYCS